MPHAVPTPYEVLDDLCTLLEYRFDRFTGNNANDEWNRLLAHHLTAAAELWRLQEAGLALPGGNGVAQDGLLWMDGNAEVGALAWHWQGDVNDWNLGVLEFLLQRSARLKVFLTDSKVDFVDERRRQVVQLLAQACPTADVGDVLVVIFSSGRPTAMAKATSIVCGCSERAIPRAFTS